MLLVGLDLYAVVYMLYHSLCNYHMMVREVLALRILLAWLPFPMPVVIDI